MPKLKIVAAGDSEQARSQRRGQLFENLMASVLRQLGYHIDQILHVNYAGMEIDIEGHSIATATPLYAECKFYETPIVAPKFVEFYGKYMSRWMDNDKAQGIFLAVPGVNSHAKAFYNGHCKDNPKITIKLHEEQAVLDAIYEAKLTVRPELVASRVTGNLGKCGDQWILFTDKGIFWAEFIMSPGAGIVDSVMLFDGDGDPISCDATVDYLTQLCQELSQFKLIVPAPPNGIQPDKTVAPVKVEKDEIVQVRGSSSWFEYQFPASPEHFVGRATVLKAVEDFADAVLNKKTSSRGLLFEANSGWGKSSVVLASIARLRELGHKAVAIDCRSTSSSASILQIVEYCLRTFSGDGEPELFAASAGSSHAITGFDGAIESLISFGREMESKGRLAFVFLDQFENMFFLPDALRRIRDLLLGICDAQTNVVFGFSWKSDLFSTASEFPFQLREIITELSFPVPIATFSEVETNALLEQLRIELGNKLRKDLQFLLSEFSQGYPWLLKKLCAHVKAQRDSGVPQAEIAHHVLNIEELFQEDLRGLTPEQDEALHRIAKLAPASVSELNDQFTPEVLQSLVHRRLVVRIGHKYDIYWDIFRDYLNTNRVPVQENYILRVLVSTVLKAAKLLADSGGSIALTEFAKKGGLTENSAYNVIRDIRLMGLASITDGQLKLSIAIPKGAKESELVDRIRVHLRDRLVRNRLVSRLVATLKKEETLAEERIALLLAEWCPYVSATGDTWRGYARILSDWMDIADLAICDTKSRKLIYYEPGTELRKRDIVIPTRRAVSVLIPGIQYMPVEKLAIELAGALEGRGKRPDFASFKKTTLVKAVNLLEDLQLVKRSEKGLRLSTTLAGFTTITDEQRRGIFAEAIVKMDSFSKFITILETYKETGCKLVQLGSELRVATGADWKDGTAAVNAKIMLDWARHTGLAPGVFATAKPRKRRATQAG